MKFSNEINGTDISLQLYYMYSTVQLYYITNTVMCQEAAVLHGHYPRRFTQLLVNIIRSQVKDIASIPPKSADFFTDIRDTVTETHPGGSYDMYYAAAYGIVDGVGDANGIRMAHCNGLLTREQAVKMMCKTIAFMEAQTGEQLYEKGPVISFTAWLST